MMEKLVAFLERIGLIKPEPVFYIGGSDVLPAPLKGQEEQDALEALERERKKRSSCSLSGICGWWCTSRNGLKTRA